MKIYETIRYKTNKLLPDVEGFLYHINSLNSFMSTYMLHPLFNNYKEEPVRFVSESLFKELLQEVEQEIKSKTSIWDMYDSASDIIRYERCGDKPEYVLEFIKNNIKVCQKRFNYMIFNRIKKLEMRNIDYPNETLYITDLPYADYLQTDHWKKIKQLAQKRDGNKCVLCSSEDNLNGHHRNYKKKGTKTEFTDVYTLCRRCHEAYHKIISKEDDGDLKL